LHVYLEFLCAHTQFREKRIFFVGCAKKKHVVKRLILVPNFVIFYIGHTKSQFFYLNPFREHIGHGDVYTIFLFEFFYIFINIENAFHIKEAYAPES
jgi:hypothetical protein